MSYLSAPLSARHEQPTSTSLLIKARSSPDNLTGNLAVEGGTQLLDAGGDLLRLSRVGLAALETETSETNWRRFFAEFGVSAAIMSCTIKRPRWSRTAYLIGFEHCERREDLCGWLLALGERGWGMLKAGDEVRPVEISDLLEKCEVRPSEISSKALQAFRHAALLRLRSGSASLDALVFRDQGAGSFESDHLKTLELLLPVILETMLSRLDAIRDQERLAVREGLLDKLASAMFIVDRDGRPTYRNAAAEELLADKSILRLASDGRLVCAATADTKLLRAAIARTIEAHDRHRTEAAVRLHGVDEDWRLAFTLPAQADVEGGAGQAILLVLPDQSRGATLPVLEALGLLPSERKFLSAFLSARSLSQAAHLSGLSEETARTYLKRIRSKLGVRRQMELARLVYSLAPPFRTEAEEHRA